MNIGVIGGYGAAGSVVVSELARTCDTSVLIGGRDLAKGETSAHNFASKVSATQVDVLDTHSLDDFCGRCSIIVNCSGPVMDLQDRVAQAAWRARCHYVDPAGTVVVKERMLPRAREIAELGLSFVVSAGLDTGPHRTSSRLRL